MVMATITLLIPGLGRHSTTVSSPVTLSSVLATTQVPPSDVYVLNNGRLTDLDSTLVDGQTYHVVPRLLGGKGGFGSMLRALGAQIEKTTNREACRDISGRRMRDVNNEQKLREWVAKASDREKERDQKRRERQERRRAEPKHTFDDPEYSRQTMQVKEGLEDALQQGLQKASSSTATSTITRRDMKRPSSEAGPSSGAKKMALEWMGVDDMSDSDSDSLGDSSSHSDDDVIADHVGSCDGADPSNRAGPSQPMASQAVDSSRVTDTEEHSDSGVESLTELKPSGSSAHKHNSPMEVDSDSTKDSAMTSDTETAPAIAPEYESSHAASGPDPTPASEACHSQNQATVLEPVADPTDVDLSGYDSAEGLETLGLDTLKALLMARGVKCGGTLQQRAARLWDIRDLSDDQIPTNLLAKAKKGR